MTDLINSWKNSNVFKRQLELNLKELSEKNSYPQHWQAFIQLIKESKIKSILDVGCGCGAYYELCRKELNWIYYTGIDYAEDAISLAKEVWGYQNFFVKDFWQLSEKYLSNYDLIHVGALFDVLPNGDEALNFLLSLNPNLILIGRMKLTNGDSFYEKYKAYDEIITYAYHHNKYGFMKLCEAYQYTIIEINNNFLLRKKNE